MQMRISAQEHLEYADLKNLNGNHYSSWWEINASGGCSVLACSFLSCLLSHSCSSLPLCSWSVGLLFVFRRRASSVCFSWVPADLIALSKHRLFPSPSIFYTLTARRTRYSIRLEVLFNKLSHVLLYKLHVCIYLSVHNGIQEFGKMGFKISKALGFLKMQQKQSKKMLG